MSQAENAAVPCGAGRLDVVRFPDGVAILHAYLDEHRIDYVFSFYTLFYTASLRRAYADRLERFHQPGSDVSPAAPHPVPRPIRWGESGRQAG